MVFPLGMYTASTWSFAHQTGVDFLDVIPRFFFWIAFIAWLATFVGMLARGCVITSSRAPEASPPMHAVFSHFVRSRREEL